jgi:hypothetical protein
MYGAGDVRVEELPDARLEAPTDAVVRVVRACVCGSDLHPYHSMPASEQGTQMGHEFIGVVEEVGAEVATIRRGDFVIAPFAYFDNTCVFCREGLSTSCEHGGFFRTAQAEAVRVPLADGTLVKAPVGEDSALLPSLLTLSDVLITGHHAAVTAGVNARTSVTVVGDGAVGPLGVLAAKDGLRPHRAAGPGRRGLPRDGRAPRHQDPAHRLTDSRLGCFDDGDRRRFAVAADRRNGRTQGQPLAHDLVERGLHATGTRTSSASRTRVRVPAPPTFPGTTT